MAEHVITFATPGNLESAWARWAEPIRARWPSDTKPRIDWMPLDSFLDVLEGQGDRGENPLPTCALVVIGPQDKPYLIDRLMEGLLTRNIPAVCLMHDPTDWKKFQRHGVLFEKQDSNPTMLAGELFALAERQGALDVMSRELYVSQRCQSGLRAEMDRVHDELNMAAAVQREFLPSNLPEIPGLDLGVVFRPVNYVSGDIYNIEMLDHRRLGFFIADAVGHGVPAALLTMVLCHNLVTTEIVPGEQAPRVIEPAEVLARLNRKLCDARHAAGRFATAVYGVLDIVSRRVTIAGAGHPPTLIIGSSGTRQSESEGPLLGVFADAEFSQVDTVLEADDVVLAYTDGLECAFPDSNADPEQLRRASKKYVEHLVRLASTNADQTVDRIVGQLTTLLDEQAGSLHQADDVTALVMRPTAQAQVLARPMAA